MCARLFASHGFRGTLLFQAIFCALLLFSRSARSQPNYAIQTIGLTQTSYNLAVDNAGQVAGWSYGIGGPASTEAWFYNGIGTQSIGLTGGAYAYTGGNDYYDYPQQMNPSGEVIGYSDRFSSTGTNIGIDAWLFNGTMTSQIGLTGPGYTYVTSDGTHEGSEAVQINNKGAIIGTSGRYTSSGTSLGDDEWIISGTTLQLIPLPGGANDSYTTSAGNYHYSYLIGLNNAGQVAGYTQRYDASGDDLGADAWFFNGASTQQIGLAGAAYSYATATGTYQINTPEQINDSGDVTGAADRYDSSGNSLGQDIWYFNGTSTVQIGLTGGVYQYTPTTGGIFRNSVVQALNNAGDAVGISSRFDSSGNDLGSDVWFYNGSTTQQIGLTGSIYQSTPSTGGTYQQSRYVQMNTSGQVIGFSYRDDFTLGLDSWIYSNGSTQQIGLTGSGYSYTNSSGTYELSEPIQINDVGDVIGYSYRFDSTGDSLGQDGWLFNSKTDATTLLRFSIDSANGDSYTDPEVVTDSGVVLGQYDLYNGSTFVGDRAFLWSSLYGFEDLGSLVNGGLTAAGWQYLADAITNDSIPSGPDSSPQYIIGDGYVIGQSNSLSYLHSTYLLSEIIVPEPAASAPVLCGLLIAAMIARPRRPLKS